MAEKRKPWMKFWPSDWRSNKELRLCGLAARGLWIEMLGLMHEAKPYGHLLVNGNPVTDTQLASLSSAPQEQVSALLAELEMANVFSRNREGVIYSRRMTRDDSKAAKCSKAGREGGGNPALKGTFKGELDPTFAPEARGHIPDIPKKDSLDQIVFSPPSLEPNDKPWSASQKKAVWQGNVCNYALTRLPQDKYASFLTGWANEEPWAIKLADKFSDEMKTAKVRASA